MPGPARLTAPATTSVEHRAQLRGSPADGVPRPCLVSCSALFDGRFTGGAISAPIAPVHRAAVTGGMTSARSRSKGFVSCIRLQKAAFLAAVGDDPSNATSADGETASQPRVLWFPLNPLTLDKSSEEQGIDDEARLH